MVGLRHGKIIHRLFEVGLIAKLVDGGLEIIGAVLLFSFTSVQLNRWVRILTQHELSEDPDDIIAGFLSRAVSHLSASTQSFAELFLLGHGLVKIGLVVALLRKHRRAYPIALVIFGFFVAYQLYRFSRTRSPWLLALSALDIFVIVITWIEYKRMRTVHKWMY